MSPFELSLFFIVVNTVYDNSLRETNNNKNKGLLFATLI